MAELSDNLLVVTVLAYCVAMVCHAAEYAFGVRAGRAGTPRAAAATATADARTAQILGVAGGGASGGRTAVLTAAPAADDRPTPLPAWLPGSVLGRLAVGTLLLAAAAHVATVVTRGLAAERLPWGNMYEFLLTSTLVGVGAWLVMLRRYPSVRLLGLFLSLVNMALLGVAAVWLYTPVGPLVPALNSYWFILHIASMVLATGSFLVGFVAAAMYLVRSGYERGKRGFPFSLARRIPAAEMLDRLAFRLHAFGFPIWTLGALIVGPIWAEAAWGRYWGWDPKEVWALVSWVIYAAFLHARATPTVKRPVAAWLAIIGWFTMMMNLFGVNFFFEGLHSYA